MQNAQFNSMEATLKLVKLDIKS